MPRQVEKKMKHYEQWKQPTAFNLKLKSFFFLLSFLLPPTWANDFNLCNVESFAATISCYCRYMFGKCRLYKDGERMEEHSYQKSFFLIFRYTFSPKNFSFSVEKLLFAAFWWCTEMEIFQHWFSLSQLFKMFTIGI